MAFGAIALLWIFKGNTERLIPLYTIGVFVPFALSQTGMVLHWKKKFGKDFLKHSVANILGAVICYGIVLILLLFRLGDIWPFFPIIIVLTWLFLVIKQHYNRVARQLRLEEHIKRQNYTGNTVIVLVGNVTRVSIGAMSYARSIGDDVVAMHVSTTETAKKDAEVAEEFADYFPDIRFETVTTSYRNIISPTVQYVIKVVKKKDEQ